MKDNLHPKEIGPRETTDPFSKDTGFRLLRFFALVSLVAVIAILLLVGYGLNTVLTHSVVEEAEWDAVRLTRAIRDFEMDLLIDQDAQGVDHLSLESKAIPSLDKRIRSFLAHFNIVKIKIYDDQTNIIYSTDPTIIGRNDLHNERLQLALGGSPNSKLESKDMVWDLVNEQRPDIDLVETYVPIYGTHKKVLGSFEIYKDVTEHMEKAQETLVRSVGILFATLVVVFGSLLAMMRFAARTIRQRTVALRESQQRFHTLAEISPVGIIRTDAEGKCTFENERWTTHFGTPDTPDAPRGTLDGPLQKDRDRIYQDWFRATREESPFRGEYQLCASDGTTRWVIIQAVQERNSEGEVTGYVGTVTDITNRKRAEETIQRHSEILEKTVEERTAELAAAKEKAEASNRAKSAFLANMSHELRTPLHGILSFADFGVDQHGDVKPDVLRDYFQRIRKSGKTLLALLNDLLDLAKLESGTMTFDRRVTTMSPLILSVADEFGAMAAERRLTIRCEQTTRDMKSEIDPDKMKQVMRNLLSNAIKFSPSGGEIDVAMRTRNGSMLISISDEGPGIPEDELESVFDKFAQSSKTKTGAGGTGLGLAICRQIVMAQGGRIWAENNAKGGAVLSIELPVSSLEGDQA